MAHYVGVFMPLESGGWRGLVPDLPACEATGPTLDLTVFHVAAVLAQRAGGANGNAQAVPLPRDLVAVKTDGAWAAAHEIDWSIAVVTMIPVGAEPEGFERPIENSEAL